VDDVGSAEASGPTPMEAMAAAVKRLARQIEPSPLSPEETHAWGVDDPKKARQVRRLLRRIELRIASSVDAEIKELRAVAPDSPWPYLFMTTTSVWGSAELVEARKKALALADKLPPARAAAVRGVMLLDDSSLP